MATCPNEYVTVTLRTRSHRGVLYATDPESGWVSVVVPGVPPRLLVVRPELVSFSGESCPDPPVLLRSTRPRSDDSALVAANAPTAPELAAALERRGMDAQVVDGGVRLLDGASRSRIRSASAMCARETKPFWRALPRCSGRSAPRLKRAAPPLHPALLGRRSRTLP